MTWTLIHLVRHGSTSYTEAGLVQGQADIPLSPRGLVEAQQAALLLATRVSPGSRVCSSDLTRARQTAQIIATQLGVPEAQIQLIPELRERALGEAEGRPWTDLPPGDLPGAEPDDLFAQRVLLGLRRAVEQRGEAVVVVAHAGTIGAVLDALGLPPRNVRPGEWVEIEATAVGGLRLATARWSRRLRTSARAEVKF